MTNVIRLCSTEEDHGAWDSYVSTIPGAHYYQTYGWLKSYQPMGFTPHVLVYEVDGTISGGVAFMSAKVPFVPWRIFIISHGPLPSDPSTPAWQPLMERLDDLCRTQGGVFATVYPHEIENEATILPRLQDLGYTAALQLSSHRFSSTPVRVFLTGKSEEEILSFCRPRTRQYVRKALGSGLQLRTAVDEKIFSEIYSLLSENAQLKGYRPRPYASLKEAWEWFAPRGGARLLQAWWNETLVGAILVVFTGRTGYYLMGAVRREYSDLRPAEFLHWHAICEAISRQMIAYDFTSLGDAGVVQFKAGFRPTVQSWAPPRTKVYRPVLAYLISFTERSLRPLMRRVVRYWASSRA